MKKIVDKTPVKKPESDRVMCLACEEKFVQQNFYKSRSKYFRGLLPWCKNCTYELWEQTRDECGNAEYAFFEFCRKIDIPWIESKFNEIDLEDKNFMGSYLIRVFGGKNKDWDCFADSDFTSYIDLLNSREEKELIKNGIETAEPDEGFKVTDEMRRLWQNPQYLREPKAYQILWTHYQMLINRFPNAEEQQRSHFPALADFWYKKERAGWDPDTVDLEEKYEKMYLNRFTAAGLSMKNAAKKDDTPLSLAEITSICTREKGFIEPWDFKKEYQHRKDDVYYAELHLINTSRKNDGMPPLDELPRYMMNEDSKYDIYSDTEIMRAAVIDEEQNLEDILAVEEEEEAKQQAKKRRKRKKSADE